MSFKNFLLEKNDEREDEIMGNIIDFFSTHTKVSDDEVHELASQLGIDKHQFEERIYSLLTSFFGAGRHKTNPPDEVDEEELQKGIKVEMEHTNSPAIARRIALDHLSEKGGTKYYTELEKMEKRMKNK